MLNSASVLSQFQFVLRFESELLRCSSSSCGTFTPGTDWEAFGTKAAMSTDAGQIDFATVASVSSLARTGSLDIGQICMDVIGSGTLQLRVQMKVHIDASGAHDCSSAAHLYQEGARCYSRTPDVVFDVACVGSGCLATSQQPPARRLDVFDRPVPLNIDSDAAQLTMADCLYLVEVQQLLAACEQLRCATETFSHVETADDSARPSVLVGVAAVGQPEGA